MKIGIMQPYLFPYLGYFQLVKSVDSFVFYDDVSFIKGGFINRNRVLINGQPKYITVPLIGASSNRKINETKISFDQKGISKLLQKLRQNYCKCEYFDEVYPLIETVFQSPCKDIAQLAALSVRIVSKYLGLATNFYTSSELNYGKLESDRTRRILEITKGLGGSTYINASGGMMLYNKVEFESEGVALLFISNNFPAYKQQSDTFISRLSIIDVLMNNSKTEVMQMLDDYMLQ